MASPNPTAEELAAVVLNTECQRLLTHFENTYPQDNEVTNLQVEIRRCFFHIIRLRNTRTHVKTQLLDTQNQLAEVRTQLNFEQQVTQGLKTQLTTR